MPFILTLQKILVNSPFLQNLSHRISFFGKFSDGFFLFFCNTGTFVLVLHTFPAFLSFFHFANRHKKAAKSDVRLLPLSFSIYPSALRNSSCNFLLYSSLGMPLYTNPFSASTVISACAGIKSTTFALHTITGISKALPAISAWQFTF